MNTINCARTHTHIFARDIFFFVTFLPLPFSSRLFFSPTFNSSSNVKVYFSTLVVRLQRKVKGSLKECLTFIGEEEAPVKEEKKRKESGHLDSYRFLVATFFARSIFTRMHAHIYLDIHTHTYIFVYIDVYEIGFIVKEQKKYILKIVQPVTLV